MSNRWQFFQFKKKKNDTSKYTSYLLMTVRPVVWAR